MPLRHRQPVGREHGRPLLGLCRHRPKPAGARRRQPAVRERSPRGQGGAEGGEGGAAAADGRVCAHGAGAGRPGARPSAAAHLPPAAGDLRTPAGTGVARQVRPGGGVAAGAGRRPAGRGCGASRGRGRAKLPVLPQRAHPGLLGNRAQRRQERRGLGGRGRRTLARPGARGVAAVDGRDMEGRGCAAGVHGGGARAAAAHAAAACARAAVVGGRGEEGGRGGQRERLHDLGHGQRPERRPGSDRRRGLGGCREGRREGRSEGRLRRGRRRRRRRGAGGERGPATAGQVPAVHRARCAVPVRGRGRVLRLSERGHGPVRRRRRPVPQGSGVPGAATARGSRGQRHRWHHVHGPRRGRGRAGRGQHPQPGVVRRQHREPAREVRRPRHLRRDSPRGARGARAGPAHRRSRCGRRPASGRRRRLTATAALGAVLRHAARACAAGGRAAARALGGRGRRLAVQRAVPQRCAGEAQGRQRVGGGAQARAGLVRHARRRRRLHHARAARRGAHQPGERPDRL